MVQSKPSPRVALSRWLAQLHYNSIRNIETVFSNVITSDRAKPLRGFKLAEDLVITRKRTFYRIAGSQAIPMTVEEVSANYNLETLQSVYRDAMEAWKTLQRARRRA